MKIIVCVSCVPDTTTKPTFIENNSKLNEQGVQFIVNPYDEYSLARAVALRDANPGSKITIITVGEASAEQNIRKALAAGADEAIRINARPVNGQYVAKQIATVLKEIGFDIIFTGKESIDYNGGITGNLIATELDLPYTHSVTSLEVSNNEAKMEREIEGGKEVVKSTLPMVLGSQKGIGEPIIPNMMGIAKARTKPLTVKEPVTVEIPTQLVTHELPKPKGAGKFFKAEGNIQDAVNQLIDALSKEAKTI
jgi:electron transfer flavoprotein beta subunit